MSEEISFTEEELNALRSFRIQGAQMIERLGSLEYEKRVVQKEIDSIHTSLDNLVAEKNNLLAELENKYGQGTVDVDSGKFYPTE